MKSIIAMFENKMFTPSFTSLNIELHDSFRINTSSQDPKVCFLFTCTCGKNELNIKNGINRCPNYAGVAFPKNIPVGLTIALNISVPFMTPIDFPSNTSFNL